MNHVTSESCEPERSDAFLALIAEVEGALRGFIRQRLGPSRLSVDDLVQKTFLKAWAHEVFDPRRNDARAFLFTIAGHLVTDWLRSDESKSISLDELSARGSLVPPRVDANSSDPMARMLAAETVEIVRAALARLSIEHQEVLERFYLRQEGKQEEIATRMNLSVAAFNSRLNRARIELKRSLLSFRNQDETVIGTMSGPAIPRTHPERAEYPADQP